MGISGSEHPSLNLISLVGGSQGPESQMVSLTYLHGQKSITYSSTSSKRNYWSFQPGRPYIMTSPSEILHEFARNLDAMIDEQPSFTDQVASVARSGHGQLPPQLLHQWPSTFLYFPPPFALISTLVKKSAFSFQEILYVASLLTLLSWVAKSIC